MQPQGLTPHRCNSITGSLLGTAIGDALGLPYEGLTPQRAARLLGPPDRYRLLPARGMVSDDTEHACMTAQALIASGGDVEAFRRDLARRLRWWLLGIPAGTGLATLRATLKLWIGTSPQRSGVWSAGNGPCMRAPILGAAVDDMDQLWQLVEASTVMTHTDPKALCGAMVVALAAHSASRTPQVTANDFLALLRRRLPASIADEMLSLLERAAASACQGEDTSAFAADLGLSRGVSGYVMHTVPVVIHAWLRYPRDYAAAVTTVIRCGGDADSTAAIVGGIVGSAVGKAGVPDKWLATLCDWPRTVEWMEKVASVLSEPQATAKRPTPPRLAILPVLVRNAFFAAVVLLHGFRRLLPPY
jgi:ADP-ribosylglycohydrolase